MKGGGVLGQVGVVKIRVGRVNGWGGLYHLLLYYYSPPRFIQGAGIWSGLGVSGVGGFGGQNSPSHHVWPYTKLDFPTKFHPNRAKITKACAWDSLGMGEHGPRHTIWYHLQTE